MIRRAEGKGKGLRIVPPGRDIRCNATSPWGENLHHVGEGKPRRLFHQTHVRLDNDTAQPLTQGAASIRSTHGKYNPSRALVDGFCLLSTNIVAFRNCFWLIFSDASSIPYPYPLLSGSLAMGRFTYLSEYG